MMDDVVQTRKQGIDEQQQTWNVLVDQMRSRGQRQLGKEELMMLKATLQSIQANETNPSLNNVMNMTMEQQRKQEADRVDPSRKPEMMDKEATLEEKQTHPDNWLKNLRFVAAFRAGIEQLKIRYAEKTHGAVIDKQQADEFEQKAYNNPGYDAKKDEIDEQLKKQEKDMKEALKKPDLSKEEWDRKYKELTGRTLENSFIKKATKDGKEQLKINHKDIDKREKKAKEHLSPEEIRKYEALKKRQERRAA